MNRTIIAIACLFLCAGTLGFLGRLGRSPVASAPARAQARSYVRTKARNVPTPLAVAAEPRVEGSICVPVRRLAPHARAPLPAGPTARAVLSEWVAGETADPAPVRTSPTPGATAPRSSAADAILSAGDSAIDVPGERINAPLSINVPFSSTDATAAATIPAALAETNPEAPLTQVEREGIAQLAEEFVAKTEAGSQDPRDPEHQRRWANAQEESDIQMRARYGGHAWLIRHRDAYRKALGNTAAQRGQGK